MIALTFVILIISLLAVTYVFFVMPRVSDGVDMDLQSSDYAHGGLAYTNLPAASYGAFKDALTLGYGIECEPVLSKDQKLFLLPFGYSKKQIISMNSDRLTELGVVSLDQLLSLVDGQVPILFTFHPFVEKIDVLLFKKICATLDVYHGAFALQSPEPSILAFLKFSVRVTREDRWCSQGKIPPPPNLTAFSHSGAGICSAISFPVPILYLRSFLS